MGESEVRLLCTGDAGKSIAHGERVPPARENPESDQGSVGRRRVQAGWSDLAFGRVQGRPVLACWRSGGICRLFPVAPATAASTSLMYLSEWVERMMLDVGSGASALVGRVPDHRFGRGTSRAAGIVIVA